MPAASTSAEADAAARSLWTRITRGFSMAPLDNDLVRDWENWYANRPDYVARMIDRSSHFLFHIVEQVEKRGMPMEIALLPMVESAYNPVAYSRSHERDNSGFGPTREVTGSLWSASAGVSPVLHVRVYF